jgi:hypothetical protein
MGCISIRLPVARYVAWVAKDPATDLTLTPLDGDPRSLNDWMKTFHLASVILDPFTNESAWILPTAARILRGFQGADVRVNFIVTADAADARTFLGPHAKEFLTFADPERMAVAALGLVHLPAFVFIRHDGTLAASAEGWEPRAWRKVAEKIAAVTAWSTPNIPTLSDPAPFTGSLV